MFSTPVLFAVLSILAKCTFATATDDKRDLSLLDGLTGGKNVEYHPTSGNPYGFGWFHPGAFQEGDRCWQNDREGVVGNALCIVAEIDIGGGNTEPFNGWFDKPYYGYGHRFGWYHPGPYLNGDRCYEDGRDGAVQDALCVSVQTGKGSGGGLLQGLNLGRRSLWGSDYWQEPRFSPGHNFGWFHDGEVADGDRCWSNGYYGSVTDSLCVLAKLDLKLKRDDALAGVGSLTNILNGGGRSSYLRGERCFKGGNWGRWRANDCSIFDADGNIGQSTGPFRDGDKCWRAGVWGTWSGSDCSILNLDLEIVKRDLPPFLFRDDHRFGRGTPCTKNGQEGVFRNAVCIIADVDLNLGQRDHHEDDVSDGVTSSFEHASASHDYDEEDDTDVAEAEEGSDEAAYDAEMDKRFLGGVAGKLLKPVNGRSLLDGLTGGGSGLGKGLGGATGGQQLDRLQANQLLATLGNGRNGNGNSPLGGLLGGSNSGQLLGKRLLQDGETSRLAELMGSIGLARRSVPTSEKAARQLDALIGKLATPGLIPGAIHERALGNTLDALTGQLASLRPGNY